MTDFDRESQRSDSAIIQGAEASLGVQHDQSDSGVCAALSPFRVGTDSPLECIAAL